MSLAGSIITHRLAVSTNDSSNPNIGAGIDCSDWRYVVVEIFLGGTTPQWTVTPLFGNTTANAYASGEAMTVSANSRYIVEVAGSSDVYFKVNGQSGTNPTITIYVTPVYLK